MSFSLSVSLGKGMAENQSNSPLPDLITWEPGCSVGRETNDQIRKWWVRFPLRLENSSLPGVVPHFLTRANVQWETHGFTLVFLHTLQS